MHSCKNMYNRCLIELGIYYSVFNLNRLDFKATGSRK